MALSANAFYEIQPRPVTATEARRVTNGAQVYLNALIGVDATTGLAEPFDGAAGTQFLGLATHERLGDTSTYSDGDSRGQVVVDVSGPAITVPVTGAAGAGDQQAEVWASDDGTFTLTDPTGPKSIGYVKKYITGTTCRVQLLSAQEWFAHA